MIKKTRHPKTRGERLQQKKLHENASPVYKLLKEKEELDKLKPKSQDINN